MLRAVSLFTKRVRHRISVSKIIHHGISTKPIFYSDSSPSESGVGAYGLCYAQLTTELQFCPFVLLL
jgi:hypothetical protein